MRRFSKLLFQAILAVLLFSGLGGALRAQTRPPIELALVPAGATFQTKGTAGYLFYAECSMDGQDQNWHFLPSMKLGNGSPVQWSFGTPEPGTPRQLYRIRISATGGYTAATAATQDTDGDSIPDMKEVENGTSPISADTDADGVADDKEAANGTSPLRFDMPAFSIVSAWRKATLWKNLSNTSQNPKVSDWILKLEADGTAKGYITDAFWSSSSSSPSSAWDPLDLSRTATAFWTSSNYTAAVPVTVRNRASRMWGYRYQQFPGDIVNDVSFQSYGEVLERTVCIKSSRLMPADWRMPYAKISAAQKSFTEGWHAPGGQPSTPPTVENGFFTIKKGFDRSSEVTLSVADDGPSPVWPSRTAFGENRPGNAESRSLQVLYLTKFGTKAGAGDADGDGVDDDLEKRMGLDPAKRNTDGMGYADGDQINQDILPPADGFRITTRAVSFIANVYSKDGTTAKTKDESLAAITDLPAATKFQYAKDQSPAYDLNKALQDKITALSPFPDKVPEAASWPLPDPISSLILYPQENPYDTVAFMDYGNSSSLGRASGDQCRVWATIPEPVATVTTRRLLKVREENPNYSGLVITAATPVTLTIPAGSTTSSDYLDLTAARPTTAATGPQAAVHNMSIREKLLPVELGTDTDNDGKVNSSDMRAAQAAYRSGATIAEIDKATEFIFANDSLSNGAWDQDDSSTPGKPSNATDDDDAEEIQIKLTGLSAAAEIWLDHPAIAGLSFYTSRKCLSTEKVDLSPSQHYIVGPNHPISKLEKLYVRADGTIPWASTTDPQVEGDLQLMLKPNGTAVTIEGMKMKFTVVKELGAKKYFHATRDYITENNTRLCARDKNYGTSTSFRIVGMREEATKMYPIDASRRSSGDSLKGIDQVNSAFEGIIHVAVNGNMNFFSDDRFNGNAGNLAAAFQGLITDKCHGRVVRMNFFDTVVSSDNTDSGTSPAGSDLAGDNYGRYIAQCSNGRPFHELQ